MMRYFLTILCIALLSTSNVSAEEITTEITTEVITEVTTQTIIQDTTQDTKILIRKTKARAPLMSELPINEEYFLGYIDTDTMVKVTKIIDLNYAEAEVNGQVGYIERNKLTAFSEKSRALLELTESCDAEKVICLIPTGGLINYNYTLKGTDMVNVTYNGIEGWCFPSYNVLNTFYTNFSRNNYNRNTNIQVAGKAIEKSLAKDIIFSFNGVVGTTTPQKGYKEAAVINEGKTDTAFGGGVCQVSTTLYNAVKTVEGVTIVERHKHSKTVDYAEEDATIWYPSLDFKFKADRPLRIDTVVTSNQIFVNVIKI